VSEKRSIGDVEALARLQRVGHLCSRMDADHDACLLEILDTAIALTSSDKGNLQILDAETRTLRIAVQRGFERPFLDFFASVSGDAASACGSAMLTSERTLVADVRKSELFDEHALRILAEARVRAVQSTPLISSRGNVLGMVSTHCTVARKWSEGGLGHLDLLARQAADFLERKKQEDALRATTAALAAKAKELETLIDILPAGVLFADPDCHRITGNRAFYRMIGLPYGSNASLPSVTSDIPKGTRVFQGERELAARELPMQAAGLTGARIADFEHEVVFPDGRRVTLLANTAPILDERGRVTAVLGAYVDITERRRAEVERESLLESERDARSRADRAGRLKDDFLAMLSHELRTPLNAIAGWTHLLKLDAANPRKVLECVEVIERNTKIQTRLISDLLDMSRITSGKMRLELMRIDVPSAVAAAVESALPVAESKGLRIRSSIEALDGSFVGDPGRFSQIVDNLLSNALKFTPRGGAIDVTLQQLGERLELRIADTGEGIPAEFLPHLFDRFRQGDSSAARRFGGLGLGLALVKQLTELHGGTVEAKSEGISKGSTFVVRLPLEPDTSRPTLVPVVKRRSAADPIDLRGVAVLVIDDDLDTLDVVRRLLEERGARVTVCGDADEGLARLRKSAVDVVVSDIGLPGRDGYEFIREVRSKGDPTPAIALTAFARAEDRTKALAAGYHAHVEKPMRPAELLAKVASLAGARRRR
jgi:signal transduction histidine kinase/CheY-like chemotaxis protein